MKQENLSNTGERLLPEIRDANALMHWHRYEFALALCRGKKVLDIASGEGYGSNLLSKVAKSVTGVDVSPEAVAHAAAKYRSSNLRYVQGSADRIPVEDATIEVAVSFETIEHHEMHDEMISELKRVLRPDGLLIISTPDKLNLTDRPGNYNPFHVKELYREEFHALVRTQFSNVAPLSQKLVYGSAMSPEGEAKGFREYWDDGGEAQVMEGLRNPLYSICVASDAELPPMPASFYDGWDVLQAEVEAARQYGIDSVVASRPYRIGRMLTWPARMVFRRKQNSTS
jgi:ubiquinone/menaquinone biosynthesis C-methylase UbiE